ICTSLCSLLVFSTSTHEYILEIVVLISTLANLSNIARANKLSFLQTFSYPRLSIRV
ncbi:unnamed protein product, partial [Rotaria magnacalcarata]